MLIANVRIRDQSRCFKPIPLPGNREAQMRFSSGFPVLRRPMIALFISVFSVSSTMALAGEYRVDAGNSSLKFIAIQQGIDFEGSFESYQAQIEFDQSDLTGSIIRATVDLHSAPGQRQVSCGCVIDLAGHYQSGAAAVQF